MFNQKKFWDKATHRRNPNHPVVLAYVLPRIKFVKDNIDINQQTTLLDVGCGNGYFTVNFAKICDTTGMDYSQTMLNLNPHNKLILGDVNDMLFNDNSFDIVFCSNLLHHVDNIKNVLNEMKRVAKKYVIISEDNRNNPLIFLYALLNKEERYVFKFTKKYLIKCGEKIGLKHKKSIVTSMVFPNKTPIFLLPILKKFDKPLFFGSVIQIIFEK